MEEQRKVIKIEDNIVSIEFADKTIEKYLITNFISKPYIGELVEFTKDGLIYESKESISKEESAKTDKILEIIAWCLLFVFTAFITYMTIHNKTLNLIIVSVGSLHNKETYIADGFIFFYLFTTGLFLHTKDILLRIIFTIMTSIIIILAIFIFLINIYVFVSCVVCLL